MATSLSGVLANIPGLAGYYAKDQLNREQTQQELAQYNTLTQLQSQMQARQRQDAARQALSALGPDATEEQRVNALLPHIGDPDKIAGVLQNAALKKSQQEQTKQIALSRLAQSAAQHMQDLAVKQRNATTAEERSHWEREIANARIGLQRQAAEIQAGRFTYETGLPAPRAYEAPVAAPAPSPTQAPGQAPSAFPSPVQAAPSPGPSPVPVPSAVPGANATFKGASPMSSTIAAIAKMKAEIAASKDQEAIRITQREIADAARAVGMNQSQIDAIPAAVARPSALDTENMDARDLRLAAMGGPAAPAPSPAPAPQPAPQPALQPEAQMPQFVGSPKEIQSQQNKWLQEQEKARQRRLLEDAKKDAKKGQLPPDALKMQQEEIDAISTSGGINADLGAISRQIVEGKLKLGLVENVSGEIRNRIGISDADSRNLATFKATLEKLRNDSLRLNKGVQTEGDAQRAWNELIANINDAGVVKQRLEEIQRINARAMNIRRLNIDGIRKNYGLDPLDVSAYEKQAPAVGDASTSTSGNGASSVRSFASVEEARSANLPAGSRVMIGGKMGTWRP